MTGVVITWYNICIRYKFNRRTIINKSRINWQESGALGDLSRHLSSGGNYKDFIVILQEKYGVTVTVGRLSQLKKQYLIDNVAKEFDKLANLPVDNLWKDSI